MDGAWALIRCVYIAPWRHRRRTARSPSGFITWLEGCSSLRSTAYHRSHLERWWCGANGVTANVGDLRLNAMTLTSSIRSIQGYSFVHTQTCHHTYGKHGSYPGSHPRAFMMRPWATAVCEPVGSGRLQAFIRTSSTQPLLTCTRTRNYS